MALQCQGEMPGQSAAWEQSQAVCFLGNKKPPRDVCEEVRATFGKSRSTTVTQGQYSIGGQMDVGSGLRASKMALKLFPYSHVSYSPIIGLPSLRVNERVVDDMIGPGKGS